MADKWYDPKRRKSLREAMSALASAIIRLLRRSRRFGAGNDGGRGRGYQRQSLLSDQMKTKLTAWLLAFGHWFQMAVLPRLRRFDWKLIQGVSAVLVVSYFLASSISTFAANGIMSLKSAQTKSSGKRTAKPAADSESGESGMVHGNVALGSPASVNTVAIKKDILQRNIFNSEGKLAPEANKNDSHTARKDMSLDFATVPCTTGELPVQINGTIYTGDPKKSFVILKDPKIADADIYKPGDAIIDHEDYEIYRVERGSLEVRKGDTKICVAISGYAKSSASSGGGDSGGASGKAQGESKEFEFDAAFISQEIGPGYATILNCAKLIPEIDASGKMQGFKMISIATSCLFDRIQIQNGDVLTEVNGISLKDPGQGFKLYQSLQEERTTTINILRNGEPITRIIRVK